MHHGKLRVFRQKPLHAAALLSVLAPQAFFAQDAPPQSTQAATQGERGTTPPPSPSISKTIEGLPSEPQANPTQPLFLRPALRDFTRPRGYFPNPVSPYTATSADPVRFINSPKLDDLVRNGRIFLSLTDAVILALENNYDIAIQRYNLDIADTDILRSKSGATLLGVNAGLVTGTIGATTAALSTGGGPGGTTASAAGAASGANGLALTTNQLGTPVETLDPIVTGTVELERQYQPQASPLFTGSSRLALNQNLYNFTYNQGFQSGTLATFTWNNSYVSTANPFQVFSPQTQSTFTLQLTQHLLRGFGPGVNGRFIVQAKNNRRVADSAFRQQVLYTINQVETIYWGLVGAYEDVQARQRSLAQSTQLASDDQKQLAIGTLAPLDVVNAKSQVASDQQALTSSQSALEYQQLVMKQAISRNLEDQVIAEAPVVPTDRVNLTPTVDEELPVEELVRRAEANRPEIEQALLALKNDEITLRGEKNALLPTLDGFAFYGGSALGGAPNPITSNVSIGGSSSSAPPPTAVGFGTVVGNAFNNSNPNKGAGVNINIPIRNRLQQSEQARSVLEFRQQQARVQQLYVQVRIQVINSHYAITNDRAQVRAADAAREFAFQSLDAEQRKLKLGASTTANVLQQERNLATAEDNLINARATYARDRASFTNVLASTLDQYGISLGDAATGKVTQQPTIPGLEPASAEKPPTPALPTPGTPGGSPNEGLAPDGTPLPPPSVQPAPPQ